MTFLAFQRIRELHLDDLNQLGAHFHIFDSYNSVDQRHLSTLVMERGVSRSARDYLFFFEQILAG